MLVGVTDYRRDISVLRLLSGYTAILGDDIMAWEGRRSSKVLEPVAAHLTTWTTPGYLIMARTDHSRVVQADSSTADVTFFSRYDDRLVKLQLSLWRSTYG